MTVFRVSPGFFSSPILLMMDFRNWPDFCNLLMILPMVAAQTQIPSFLSSIQSLFLPHVGSLSLSSRILLTTQYGVAGSLKLFGLRFFLLYTRGRGACAL